MQFLIYILVYPFLWFISMLPFRLLYILSDLVFILLYYIIGYRKKVVTENLKLVFPSKSKKEIDLIKTTFYRHLCDMFLEMAKTMNISKKELKKRFQIVNTDELKRLESLNKTVILMFGHYASWEWAIEIQNHIAFKGYGIYKKLANPYFDRLVRNIRDITKETISTVTNNENQGIKSVVAFLSDQSPRLSKEVYWGNFMGVRVPCFTGAERLAKKLNLTIAYLKVNKVKRGYYKAEIITLTETPKNFKDYELTDLFLREVEKQIYEAPEYYFWTHNRWKHKDKIRC